LVSSVTAACSVWPLTSGIVEFAGGGAVVGLVVVPTAVEVVGAVVVAALVAVDAAPAATDKVITAPLAA